jgi:hypothetical protein
LLIDCILIAYRLPLQQEQLLASQAQFQAEMQDLEDRAREEAEWQEVSRLLKPEAAGINSRLATATMHMRQQREAARVAERQFAAVKQEEERKQWKQDVWQLLQQQEHEQQLAAEQEWQQQQQQQELEQQLAAEHEQRMQQEHEQQMAAEQQQRIYMQQQTGIVVPLHTTPRKLDKAMSLGDVKIQAIYYLLYKYNI